MKQTLLLKLAPSEADHAALLQTMEAFNEGVQFAFDEAFARNVANKIRLQPFVYGELRARFHLSSQMAVRAIAKAVETLKALKAQHRNRVLERNRTNAKRVKKGLSPLDPIPPLEPCRFDPHGAMVYDERIMSFRGVEAVSLLTLQGRVIVPMRYGSYQSARMDRIRGQADLLFRNGAFFLAVTIDSPEPPEIDAEDVLGVDLGIENVAFDSDGEAHSGEALKAHRAKVERHRSALQKKGTKSAKRRLKRIGRKQSRFARNENHRIANRIVAKLKDSRRALGIEDLNGIRDRANGASRELRRILGQWSFFQLRSFLEYKARLAGIPVVLADPAYTSMTCSECGHCEKANRPAQDRFECRRCGFRLHADWNAAKNLQFRAALSYGLSQSVPQWLKATLNESMREVGTASP